MSNDILVRLFEHNNWANLRMIQACSALSDEQLDAEPQSATRGSIRATLLHLAAAQQNYLSLLTLPFEQRTSAALAYGELAQSVSASGEGLLALARGDTGYDWKTQLRTRNGYLVEPWVVMLQAINHATEHREQISSMLTALGVTPPDLDGWSYGEAANALVPVAP
jgi:uncharacterized damage-inducible protein DinB